MQISSRFTIAVHIFACIDTFKEEFKLTSVFGCQYQCQSGDYSKDIVSIKGSRTCESAERKWRRFDCKTT